ncbi:hypothetical protein IGI53_002759 [Enterococcus sp. DIV0788_1]
MNLKTLLLNNSLLVVSPKFKKNAKADIYNRLVSARDAAVEHQKQTIAQGGTANDVQSPLSALIFESNILETEYPQYIDYIRTTIKELGY